MDKDKHETAVLFRKYPNIEGGAILALFPELPGDMQLDTCCSYQRIGQHGAAHLRGCIDGTRVAKPAEYEPIKRELESIGYRLIVYKRTRRAFDTARRQALQVQS